MGCAQGIKIAKETGTGSTSGGGNIASRYGVSVEGEVAESFEVKYQAGDMNPLSLQKQIGMLLVKDFGML